MPGCPGSNSEAGWGWGGWGGGCLLGSQELPGSCAICGQWETPAQLQGRCLVVLAWPDEGQDPPERGDLSPQGQPQPSGVTLSVDMFEDCPVDSLEPRNTLQEPPGRAPPWTRVPLICFRSHSPGRLPSCLLRAPHWPGGKGTLSPLGPLRGTEGGWRAGAQGSTQRGKRPAVAPRTLAARSCSPRPVLVAAPSGRPASCPCAWPSPCPQAEQGPHAEWRGVLGAGAQPRHAPPRLSGEGRGAAVCHPSVANLEKTSRIQLSPRAPALAHLGV